MPKTDEMTLNEIIIANLPKEISIENKLKHFREIDKGFLKIDKSTEYILLRPYDKDSQSMYLTIFKNLEKISDVFKFIEKYIGKIRLIDTDFDEEFQGKIDFWVEDSCYSLMHADNFIVDIKEGI
ncbi:MAG: hypothetical protein KQ78_01896 [Candidatus Izimaplasma bacterium HR2]|nr:MAG: hypothetical protein KQ78_01896 [Candidatus Izimaplasma bacterium HR2]